MSDEQRQQGVTGSRNREGIIKVSAPWWVLKLDQCLTVGDATFLGLPEENRTWTQRKGNAESGFDVVISYEGMTDEGDGQVETYEWTGSFSKEPVETHPRINLLIAQYGGRIGADGKILWDPKLPKDAPKGGVAGAKPGLSRGKDAGEDEKNPMYGQDSFHVMGAIFRRTRAFKKVPASVITNIGRIVRKIPGDFPTPDERDWLVMPPRISARGNAYEVSDEYMLSAPGGWPEAFHELIQI